MLIMEVAVGYFINSKTQNCTCTISEIEMDFILAMDTASAVLALHVIINDIQVSVKCNMYYTDFH